ncbi:MAG: hypothetical protein ABI843_11675 [Dokdonella sp.]
MPSFPWKPFVVSSLVAALLVPALSAAVPLRPQGDGISLTVGLGTDLTDGACSSASSLEATIGDQINICYVVSNDSTTTLDYQSLADDLAGPIFTAAPITLLPGASYQYNRIVSATSSIAPTATWTAYDGRPDYVDVVGSAAADRIFGDGFDGSSGAPPYAFVEIADTGTNLALFDDDAIGVSLGFPFSFYGQTSDQIVVSNNGGILFGVSAGFISPRNLPLPNSQLGAAILPYWTDIYESQDGGDVYVQQLGVEPTRSFVVEWKEMPISIGGFTDGATFEVIFYEGSNRIVFQYADTIVDDPARDNGITTTIGIQKGDTQNYLQYSYLEASVSDGMVIAFNPSQPLTYSASQQVQLDVGAPVIGVDPASFEKTIAAGASTTDTLTIGNSGNRDLLWSLGQVPNRSNFPPVSRFALPMGDPALTRGGARPQIPHKPFAGVRPNGFGGSVPAFANDPNTSTLYSLDAAAPSGLTTIADLGGLQFFAGDFVGEDFSTLVAIDYRSFDLYHINTATGARTRIDVALVPPGASAEAWNGLSWDATTHTMFATSADGARTRTSYLETIDPNTAATTLVGPITGVGDPNDGTLIIDIAVDSTGQMYGVDIVTDTLVAIDKTSGEAQTIGSIGFDANYSEDLDFDDYTGTLYFAAFNAGDGLSEMYTLNTESGLGTLISPISSDPAAISLDAFAIARLGGVCAYPGDVPWLSYDVSRGSTVPGATSPVTLTFDATGLDAGSYSADLCIYSNDPANRRLAVPVTLTVQ